MHRIVAAALLVAAKICTDKFYTNAHFAKVAGTSVKDLNRLELEIIVGLRFELNIPEAALENLRVELYSNELDFRNTKLK